MFTRPIPRPSCARYSSTPAPSSAMRVSAPRNCWPQSQRRLPSRSPVKHSECRRTSGADCFSGSPTMIARCSVPALSVRKATTRASVRQFQRHVRGGDLAQAGRRGGRIASTSAASTLSSAGRSAASLRAGARQHRRQHPRQLGQRQRRFRAGRQGRGLQRLQLQPRALQHRIGQCAQHGGVAHSGRQAQGDRGGSSARPAGAARRRHASAPAAAPAPRRSRRPDRPARRGRRFRRRSQPAAHRRPAARARRDADPMPPDGRGADGESYRAARICRAGADGGDSGWDGRQGHWNRDRSRYMERRRYGPNSVKIHGQPCLQDAARSRPAPPNHFDPHTIWRSGANVAAMDTNL